MSSFFELAQQCCDAGSYIQFGEECATTGVCHGDLRPMGDYFWFSIPSRLGLADGAFVLANWLIIVFGLLVSFFTLRKLLLSGYCKAISTTASWGLFLVCALVYVIFLVPTAFNSLSDPPASMLFMNGVWFLVLLHFAQRRWVSVVFAILAGVSLGLSAWVRAFNLYPVLVCVAAYVFLWIFSKPKKYSELLVCLALLPVGTQYWTMHKAYGTYSYLGEEQQSAWTNMHLGQPFIGFDTIFPRNGYFWTPQHCEAKLGILNGLEAGDYQGVACVVWERLYFYLGTYRSKTYLFSSATNQLVRQYAEDIGDINADWFPQKLTYEKNVAYAPNGQKTADKLTVTERASDGAGDVVQWVELRGNTPHTFSVWLWSEKPKSINLAIKFHADDTPIAAKQVYLTDKPTRYSITGTTLRSGLYDVDIGRTPYPDDGISMGSEVGDSFYAWGAQLELGETATDYNANEKIRPDSVRIWYPWLFVLNIGALLVLVIGIIWQRAFWLKTRSGIAVLLTFCVMGAEALAIIPEQRFCISLMIFIWIMAATFLWARCRPSLSAPLQ